jgi:hypothetical protein
MGQIKTEAQLENVKASPQETFVETRVELTKKQRRENYVFGTEINQSFAFGIKKFKLSYLTPS